MQGFLGAAGLACYGEVPDAATWLKYVLTATLTCYPFWGDADGGWAQGLSYWSAYYYWLAQWGEIAKRAARRRPPPARVVPQHGLLRALLPPVLRALRRVRRRRREPAVSLQEKIAVDLLARVHRDPYLRWHVSQDAGVPR